MTDLHRSWQVIPAILGSELMRPLILLFSLAVGAFAAGLPYLTQTALCPARPVLVFASGGDIWGAPAKSGEVHLPVSHPAEEARPLYSADGTKLAFVSTRSAGENVSFSKKGSIIERLGTPCQVSSHCCGGGGRGGGHLVWIKL